MDETLSEYVISRISFHAQDEDVDFSLLDIENFTEDSSILHSKPIVSRSSSQSSSLERSNSTSNHHYLKDSWADRRIENTLNDTQSPLPLPSFSSPQLIGNLRDISDIPAIPMGSQGTSATTEFSPNFPQMTLIDMQKRLDFLEQNMAKLMARSTKSPSQDSPSSVGSSKFHGKFYSGGKHPSSLSRYGGSGQHDGLDRNGILNGNGGLENGRHEEDELDDSATSLYDTRQFVDDDESFEDDQSNIKTLPLSESTDRLLEQMRLPSKPKSTPSPSNWRNLITKPPLEPYSPSFRYDITIYLRHVNHDHTT